MRLWLNKIGEVSLREQLITQVILAILCRELLPGQRLPSTRPGAPNKRPAAKNTPAAMKTRPKMMGMIEPTLDALVTEKL